MREDNGLLYLDESLIEGKRADDCMPYGQGVMGYGRKIATNRMLKVLGRWRRVYVTIFSNSGTSWVVIDKKHYIVP